MLPSTPGAASGLGAAFLFGLSTPDAKLLLPRSGPFMLAGLLHLGSALGLVGLGRRAGKPLRSTWIGLAVILVGSAIILVGRAP